MVALFTLAGLGTLVAVIVSHRAMARAIHRPPIAPPKRLAHPSVTVVRPIRGLDVGARENFAAALALDYPGEVETLFVLDDADDPAYPIACQVVDEHRRSGRAGRAEVLIAGPPPAGRRTGKLNAMIRGLERARGQLIAFGDSDTRPHPALLRQLVERLLEEPRAGCVFAPVVVDRPPETISEVGYALMINAWYGPSVALAQAHSELPFIMGQLMVITRGAIAAIGGLSCAEGQLTDDMYIGARVAQAGLRNVMGDHPLSITVGVMPVADFLRLMRRWFLFMRNGIPHSFLWLNALRGIEYWVPLVLGVVALLGGRPLAALAPLVAAGAWVVSQKRIVERFGGAPIPPRLWWVIAVLPLVMPIVELTTLRRTVAWRGRAYALEPRARLKAETQAPNVT